MATTATAPRPTVKEYTFQWVGLDRNQPRGARRDRGRRPKPSSRPTCGGRASASPRSSGRRCAAGAASAQKDITFFTRQLATMLKAGVPMLQAFDIVARGHSNAALLAADDADQEQDRGGLEPVAGVPRAPAAFRRPVLQPRARRRDVGHDRRDPRPARALPREDPRDQEQDQERAVLPDLGDGGGDRRGVGDHGLGDPGVQAGVHELRRRPAGADADGDRDLRFRRRVVVARVPRHRRHHRRGAAVLYRRSAAFRVGFDRLLLKLPGDRARSSRRRRSRAGRARWPRCSPPACRWSNRSTPSAGAVGQRRVRGRHQEDPDRRQHRHEPHQRDEQHR